MSEPDRRPIPNFPDYAIDNTGVVWRMTPSIPQVEARCGPAPRALRAVNVTNGRSARKHVCVRIYEPHARRPCMRSVAKLMRDVWPEVVRERAVHAAHCNQGEYEGSCKYGEADCPEARG